MFHNSIRAGASEIIIRFIDSDIKDIIEFCISDNGKGITEDKLKMINNNFYSERKERNIGLGLAILKYHSQLCDGNFIIESKIGKGTKVCASFRKSHVDRQPIGNLAECIANFICQFPDINFIFSYESDNNHFYISTNEIKDIFNNIDLNTVHVINLIKNFIAENISKEN